MNSGYIGPRKVAPRAPLRWAKQALAMILREPLLVTAALVLFLLLDHGFLVLTSGQEFALRITLQLISPAFLTTFLVLLRRLDTGVFQEIDLRGALWMALRWGGGQVAIVWALITIVRIDGLLTGLTLDKGQVLASIESSRVPPSLFVCTPMLALVPIHLASRIFLVGHETAGGHTLLALDLNRVPLVGCLLVGIAIAAIVVSYALWWLGPVFLLFGVAMHYVAYRDIFEHRDANEPKRQASASRALRT